MTNVLTAGVVPETESTENKREEHPLRVLFVCTGNTCRSPMAAAIFNDMAKKKRPGAMALSAGLFARPGDPVTPMAVKVLAEAGVVPQEPDPYPTHVAHPVEASWVRDADAVVAMSDRHAMELLFRYPEAAGKISTLPFELPDPFGGAEAVYRACFDKLQYAVALRFFTGDADNRAT